MANDFVKHALLHFLTGSVSNVYLHYSLHMVRISDILSARSFLL